MSSYYFRAPCRVDIALEMSDQGKFVVVQGCEACGVVKGAPLSTLMSMCSGCNLTSFSPTEPKELPNMQSTDGNGTSKTAPSGPNVSPPFKMPQISVPLPGSGMIGAPASQATNDRAQAKPPGDQEAKVKAQTQQKPPFSLPQVGPQTAPHAALNVSMAKHVGPPAPKAVAPPIQTAPTFDTVAPSDNQDAEPQSPNAAPVSKAQGQPQSEASRLLSMLFAPKEPVQEAIAAPAPAPEPDNTLPPPASEPAAEQIQPAPAPQELAPQDNAAEAAGAVEQPVQVIASVAPPQPQQAASAIPAPPVPVEPQAQVATIEAAKEPPAVQSQASFGLPASSSMNALLTDLISGGGGEESVDIEAALNSVPGIIGGPSKGGFSWHTIADPMSCWRKAYYSHVLGLTPKTTPKALAFGTMYHACWELWYRTGGQRPYDEPCTAVQNAGAPKLAAEVRRLVYTELQKYAQQEAEEWDIRAVEQNAVFWSDPQRINGKTVHIPFCCRHDHIIAKRGPGAPCSPAGPVPQGTYVVDRKSASALTYDLTKGYSMDGQFLMNALVYKRSDEPEKFGPFVGMIFSVAAKHKDPHPDKSFFRVETVVEEETLEKFHKEELIPYATEFYRRLASERIRGDINQWPKNHSQCVGRYGCCYYFDLCDVGGSTVMEAMFKQDPGRIFTLDKLWEPPPEAKRKAKTLDGKTIAAKADRQKKAEHKKRIAGLVLDAFVSAACSMDLFQPKAYMVVGHTQKSVLDKLTSNLSRAWPVGTAFEFGPDAEGNQYNMEVVEKGMQWTLKEATAEDEGEQAEAAEGGKKKRKAQKPLSGVLTYRSIATKINTDWWDTAKQQPVTS